MPDYDSLNEGRLKSRLFGGNVTTLAAGEAETFDCRGMAAITIITGAGATATYSRVNDETDAAHVTGAENGSTVAATTKLTIPTDWPFIRVSSAGGATRVAMV